MRTLFVLLFGLLPASSPAGRPNIVLMMADDMGFSDLGCYGSEIDTPNLDRLAARGLRYTQFYNTGRCCPSRASLLSGAYSHRAGIGHMNHAGKRPGYWGELRSEAVTIAESLKAAGYDTWMVGKWHVTGNKSVVAKKPNGSWPLQRGFDRFYGTMEGAKDYFAPTWLYDQEEEITEFPDGYYYEHGISGKAAGWIRKQPVDKPFFLYTAFYAPHFPLQAPEGTITKYRSRYKAGWDKLRAERLKRQIASGLIPASLELSPRPSKVPAWEDVPEDRHDELDHRMAIYAAQVEELDRAVGTVVTALHETGRLENTLLVFLSDNGGASTGGPYGKGKRADLNKPGVLHVTYGSGWANLSDTPYRRFKTEVHEGGILSPLIVHWPKRIPAHGIRRQFGHIIDLHPTFIEAAGGEVLRERKGRPVVPLQGHSLVPSFAKDAPGPRTLFWEHGGNRAVRDGDWKLVALGKKGAWELYNLAEDPTELQDLSAQNPGKARALEALWFAWARENKVLPLR